jgi:hypothetical protein
MSGLNSNLKLFFVGTFILLFQDCMVLTDGGTVSLGKGYKVFISKHSIDLLGKENELIMATMKDYQYNDSAIVAYRNINQLFRPPDSTSIIWEKGNPSDSIQFWIVDKMTDSIYGPLNTTQFNYKCKKRNLSIGVRFDFAHPKF